MKKKVLAYSTSLIFIAIIALFIFYYVGYQNENELKEEYLGLNKKALWEKLHAKSENLEYTYLFAMEYPEDMTGARATSFEEKEMSGIVASAKKWQWDYSDEKKRHMRYTFIFDNEETVEEININRLYG